MEELRREGETIVLSISHDELQLITGALNEARNGPYAIPADEWVGLVGQPPGQASAVLRELVTILER